MATPTELKQQADAFRCAGRGDRAIPRYKEAYTLFLEGEEPAEASECQHMLGVSLIFEARYTEGVEALKQALRERNDQHRVVDGARVLRDLAIAEMLERHYLNALEFFLRSRNVLVTTDNFGERGITESKLGRLYSLTGEFSLVDECFDEAYQLIGKAVHPTYQIASHIDNAIACLERAQFGHLDNHLAQAWRILEETEEIKHQIRRVVQIYVLQIRSAINKGEWSTARNVYNTRFRDCIEGISPGGKAGLDKELQISELPQLLSLP